MKNIILALSIAAAIVALAGCSSFNMGAACYVPHGVTGHCSATTVEPGIAAPAPAESAAAAKKKI